MFMAPRFKSVWLRTGIDLIKLKTDHLSILRKWVSLQKFIMDDAFDDYGGDSQCDQIGRFF